MTYLELLLKIKDGTQPKAIRADGTYFRWYDDVGYVSERSPYEYVHDDISDIGLLTLEYIEIVEA